jgi:hypothetical protein
MKFPYIFDQYNVRHNAVACIVRSQFDNEVSLGCLDAPELLPAGSHHASLSKSDINKFQFAIVVSLQRHVAPAGYFF